jgi:hypothetical protein
LISRSIKSSTTTVEPTNIINGNISLQIDIEQIRPISQTLCDYFLIANKVDITLLKDSDAKSFFPDNDSMSSCAQ